MSARLAAEPNVTPMIDVMLVLLIIFMVVAPMLMGAVAEPPRGTNLRAHPEAEGDVTLAVDAAGRFVIDHREVTPADLPARLRTAFAGRSDRVLYLTADRRVGYARVLDAMNVARENGVAVVGLIAVQESRTP